MWTLWEDGCYFAGVVSAVLTEVVRKGLKLNQYTTHFHWYLSKKGICISLMKQCKIFMQTRLRRKCNYIILWEYPGHALFCPCLLSTPPPVPAGVCSPLPDSFINYLFLSCLPSGSHSLASYTSLYHQNHHPIWCSSQKLQLPAGLLSLKLPLQGGFNLMFPRFSPISNSNSYSSFRTQLAGFFSEPKIYFQASLCAQCCGNIRLWLVLLGSPSCSRGWHTMSEKKYKKSHF